ncbi:S8 family peptidase [Kallotenue papyrolyticum]|uniref:S8 family peptidase n=1 Tax=Kallotenue papyrolyticum TaxID=1325125 RepID=UPI0004924C5D|nr:S8 family peptidase [Kallotenue papyrolyticum]
MDTRFRSALGLAVLLLLALGTALRPATAAPRAGDRVPGQYIVVFKDSVSDVPGKADALAAQHGLSVQRIYTHALKGFAARIPEARLAKLQADPDVAFIDQDQVISIDAQEIPTGIRRIEATLSPTARIDGTDERVNVDVAIIDTGIAPHADLNIYRSVNCSGGSPLRGSCKSSSPADGNGHGTHVAGTVAALDNGSGVVGVAPGARLWAVKVLNDQGSGYRSWIIAGIDYVTANAGAIEVANMSLGGSGTDDGKSCAQTTDAYKKALCNSIAAGVTYAVAAGNESDDARNHVPAAYVIDGLITVSALADFNGLAGGGAAPTCRSDEDDTFANFSNYGPRVDIIAPGVCILSTWNDGGYNTISGTSMATPHVAGAAALYKAKNPGATPKQVRDALVNAGTSDWNNVDDRDSIKEPLLNVKNF